MTSASFGSVLRVDPVGDGLFAGTTPPGAFTLGIVFGGQLLGQAIGAAIATMPDRPFHSFHAYYLRAGKIDQPVTYRVETVRDGGAFSVRRVIASQDGKQVLEMTASFKAPEAGVSHQDTMPDVPPPDALPANANRALWEAPIVNFPFEMRRVIPVEGPPPPGTPATQRVWVRALDLDDAPHLHDAALAYIADYGLLAAALIPHEMAWNGVNPPASASLDQAVWRHRPSDMREWHLLDLHSPSASDGRGLGLGWIWRHDGTLIASTAQEGFMRAI